MWCILRKPYVGSKSSTRLIDLINGNQQHRPDRGRKAKMDTLFICMANGNGNIEKEEKQKKKTLISEDDP